MNRFKHGIVKAVLLGVFVIQGSTLSYASPELDHWVSTLTEEMIRTFQTGSSRLNIPSSMGRPSPLERFRNQMFLHWVLRNAPEFIERRRQEGEAYSMADMREDVRQSLENLDGSSSAPLFRGGIFRQVYGSIQDPQSIEGALFADGNQTQDDLQRFRQQVERDRETYGEEFFTPTVVAKGAVDVLGTGLHAVLRGHQPVSWDGMYAIGMLHPITDQAADEGHLSAESYARIMKKLRLEAVEPKTPFERLVFDFVDRIYRDFSPDEHAFLYWLLPKLFEEQMRSAIEKPTEPKEILRSAFLRGGLSSLAFAYPTLGGLDEWERWAYYQGGGIYQLLDDLTDIPADQKEGIPSIWTVSHDRDGNLKKAFRGLMALEAAFERQVHRTATKPAHRSTELIHARGFSNILIMALLLNQHDPVVKGSFRYMRQVFPVPTRFPLRVFALVRNLTELDPSLAETEVTDDGGFNQFIERAMLFYLQGEVPPELDGLTTTEILSRLQASTSTLRGRGSRLVQDIVRNSNESYRGGEFGEIIAVLGSWIFGRILMDFLGVDAWSATVGSMFGVVGFKLTTTLMTRLPHIGALFRVRTVPRHLFFGTAINTLTGCAVALTGIGEWLMSNNGFD